MPRLLISWGLGCGKMQILAEFAPGGLPGGRVGSRRDPWGQSLLQEGSLGAELAPGELPGGRVGSREAPWGQSWLHVWSLEAESKDCGKVNVFF